jgi:DNA-binding MarR family transcriptional regulator
MCIQFLFDDDEPEVGVMAVDDSDDLTLVSTWASVVRAVDAVQQAFALRLDKLEMSLPYFSVLTLLLESPDQRLPMSRIARDLSMTSGGFTKLADRMARDGLIDRRGSSGDRRVVFAALTDDGLKLARAAETEYRAFLREEVLQVISERDLTTLSSISGRLGAIRRDPDAEVPTFEISPRPSTAPERRSRDRD